MNPADAPFGSWPSPVTAEMLTAPRLSGAQIQTDGEQIWWHEVRPDEDGRTQLVRLGPGGPARDVLPAGFNARTLVHEYGGGAWCVSDGTLLFSNFEDQRLYRLDPGATQPVPISPEPVRHGALRYADLNVVPAGTWGPVPWVVTVRESHEQDATQESGEPRNEIVALPLDGSAVDPKMVTVLASGADFVASPQWFDGRLAWVQWDHPNMPWDNTALFVATTVAGQTGPTLIDTTLVAGGSLKSPESVMQPRWGADGSLWFVSDRDEWWNLYRRHDGQVTQVSAVHGEIGHPAWVLGASAYAFLPDGRVVAALNREGSSRLVLVDPEHPDQPPAPIDSGLTSIEMLRTTTDGQMAAVAGGPTQATGPVRVSLAGRVDTLRTSDTRVLGADWVSAPEPVRFTSTGGRESHAVLYRPRNPGATPPPDELPPLLVVLHGGPTSQGETALSQEIQYWTTRGFAVADVDYTGSTGYGREYRRALYGQWGVADVEDCLAVVRHLADAGIVDGHRAAIRGGSAGGFTTLAALTHPDNVFATGASYYGIADLEVLAGDTHKFESRYCDQLIGPLPEAAEVYRERSPINHVDRLRVPLAVFQGAEDLVVPPAQSRMIVDAVRAKGQPCVYLEFPGEQHGFRQTDSLIRSIETELWFYGRVFGFDPPIDIEPPADSGF